MRISELYYVLIIFIAVESFIQKPRAFFPHIVTVENCANISFSVTGGGRYQTTPRLFGISRFYAVAALVIEKHFVFVGKYPVVFVPVIRRTVRFRGNYLPKRFVLHCVIGNFAQVVRSGIMLVVMQSVRVYEIGIGSARLCRRFVHHFYESVYTATYDYRKRFGAIVAGL